MSNLNFWDSFSLGFRNGMINNARWNFGMPFMNSSTMFMSMPMYSPMMMLPYMQTNSVFSFNPNNTTDTTNTNNNLFNFTIDSSNSTTTNNTNFFENAFKNFNFTIGSPTSGTSGVSTSSATSDPPGEGVNRRVDTTCGLTAAQLDKSLSGVLSGKGQKFLDAEKKYGVNAAFLVAICNLESGHGTSHAATERNNVAGIKDGKKVFSSVDECIDYAAKNLAQGKYYFTQGKKTIAEIGPTYCNEGWAPKVSAVLDNVLEKAG